MWGLVTVRDTAPLSFTLTKKPLRRRELESMSVAVTMSGMVLVMRDASVCGAGVFLMASKLWAAYGREGVVFVEESSLRATSLADQDFPLPFLFGGWVDPATRVYVWMYFRLKSGWRQAGVKVDRSYFSDGQSPSSQQSGRPER